jgi:hypothetical protein
MFVEIQPYIAVSDFVRRVKGRSSHRVRMDEVGEACCEPAPTRRTGGVKITHLVALVEI